MLIEVCFVDTDDANDYIEIGYNKIAAAIYKGITGLANPIVTQTGGTNKELTSVNDIIWELHHRGVITDKVLWTTYCNTDTNVYWFCRKMCSYISGKTTSRLRYVDTYR